MPTIDPLRTIIRRKVGLERYEASLGDSSGVIYEPGRPGMVRVRYLWADGESMPTTVRQPRLPTSMTPGTAVWVGYDEDEQYVVLGPRISGQLAAGMNPNANQANSDSANTFVDLSYAAILRAQPASPPSLNLIVRAFIYMRDNVANQFPGEIVDMTSYRPGSAGEHRLAGMFVKTDNTIGVYTSTAQSALDPLDLTDVQECMDNAVDSAIPVHFWRLENAMTAITDEYSFLDGRQFINIGNQSARNAVVSTAIDYVMNQYDEIVLVDASGANRTITLPARVQPYKYTVKKTDASANTVIVTPPAGNIDGAGTKTLTTQYEKVTVITDGTNWFII